MSKTHLHETDVLIVGGGVTAACAAIKASEAGVRVLLVDKGFFGRSGTSALASGVFQAYMEGDDLDRWVKAHTNPMVNITALREGIKVTGELLKLMDQWGVKWIKDKGKIQRVDMAVGPLFPVNAMMAEGGPQFMMALRNETLRRGVDVVNRVMITELLTSDGQHPTKGRVVGALGFDTIDGDIHVFRAKTTIMCTGPVHIPYPKAGGGFHGMPINCTGDGVAAAYRAGAQLSKMEFLAGWGVIPAEFYSAPGLEMGAGLGVRFVNDEGTEIAGGDRIRRFRLARSVIREYGEGRGPIYKDVSPLSPEDLRLYKQVVPIVLNTYERSGYDPSRDPVPFVTMLPFQSGTLGGAGIRVAENGATTVPGLFAAGNTSDGAFMGLAQALNLCAVGGWYAGEAASGAAQGASAMEAPPEQIERLTQDTLAPLEQSDGTDFVTTRDELEALYGTDITEVLNAHRLEDIIAKVEDIRNRLVPKMKATEPHDLAKVLGMRNFLQCMEISVRVVQRRTESRGNVLREDFPYMDNENWLKYTFARMGGNGQPELFDEAIPDDAHHRMPKRDKVLHPFFRS